MCRAATLPHGFKKCAEKNAQRRTEKDREGQRRTEKDREGQRRTEKE
jgi:hypothetical protein